MKSVNVYLFQRDIRIDDHLGLAQAKAASHPLVLMYVYTPQLAQTNQMYLITHHIAMLNRELEQFQTRIMICPMGQLEQHEVFTNYHINEIHFGYTYTPDCFSAQSEMHERLAHKGIAIKGYHVKTYTHPAKVAKEDGTAYVKYSAFRKRWMEKWEPKASTEIRWQGKDFMPIPVDNAPEEATPFHFPSINLDLDKYAELRDIPSKSYTSNLSTWLAIGAVSPQRAYQLINQYQTVVDELIWREFFIHVAYFYPRALHQNFKTKYNGIIWRNNEYEFVKWCQGETGYPLVDAGMQELNQTGRMHNRVRMVVASFLCKHLLIEWQWGAAYFAQKLLDYDEALNAGNWQWVAGTGCDSAPYFRIFNPITQHAKFDPNNADVQKWVPPGKETIFPLVDHKQARMRALDTYKEGITAF